jgi:hypothetical protein
VKHERVESGFACEIHSHRDSRVRSRLGVADVFCWSSELWGGILIITITLDGLYVLSFRTSVLVHRSLPISKRMSRVASSAE